MDHVWPEEKQLREKSMAVNKNHPYADLFIIKKEIPMDGDPWI